MDFSSYDHGVPSWVDVSAPDVDSAADFYSKLFGWDIPPGVPEAGGYRIAHLRGRTVAGLGPQQDPNMPPAWTTYVNVDDADAVAAKITANGGQVLMPPMDVMDQGRMAIAMDPAGAVFGLWQPGAHTGAQVATEPNAFTWSELVSTDIDAVKPFYAAVFGWAEETHEGPMPYTEFAVDGKVIAGGMPKPPMIPAEVPSFWTVYFAVDDLEAMLGTVKELGGTILMPGMDTPAGRFAAVADRAGASFSLIKLTDDHA